jgi:predicted outer membrane repeat protein
MEGVIVMMMFGMRMAAILMATGLSAGLLGVVTTTAEAASTCHVRNGSVTGVHLQSIINRAHNGDKILIRGVCVGNFRINKNLTLVGRRTPHVRWATLDGGSSGSVVSISRGIVTLRDLTIAHGSVPGSGGGIVNYGSLTLKGSTRVNRNSADTSGGGIVNYGSLVLKGSALVGRNSAPLAGGILNFSGSLTMDGSSRVKNNTANGGAGIFSYLSSLTMKGSSRVIANVATQDGGGIYTDSGTLTMNDSSSVTRNTAFDGGGIYASSVTSPGTVTLNDTATVTRNTAGVEGGGILNDGATLVGATAGLNVVSNDPDDIFP